jgi:hypothetical protein
VIPLGVATPHTGRKTRRALKENMSKPKRFFGVFDPWRNATPVPEVPKEELVDALENEGRDEVVDARVTHMFRGTKMGVTLQVPAVGDRVPAEAVRVLLDALALVPEPILKKHGVWSVVPDGNRITLAYQDRRMYVMTLDASVHRAIDAVATALMEAELDPAVEKQYQQLGVVPWRLA